MHAYVDPIMVIVKLMRDGESGMRLYTYEKGWIMGVPRQEC